MSTVTRPARRRASPPGRIVRTRQFWLLVLPALVLVLLFRFIPVSTGFFYAFTDWNGVGTAEWVGVDNFMRMFQEATTRTALANTLLIGAVFVVLVNALGLLFALLVRRAYLRLRPLARAAFFLPVVLSELAVAYVWRYILSYDGPVNGVLDALGLAAWKRAWLADPEVALPSVIVVVVWQFVGLAMVIYLAGLESIPIEIEEAASMDGAGWWLALRRITLPLLAPALTVSLTLSLIFGLRIFDQIVALTGGGPVNATETLATQVWKITFVYGEFGYGAAVSFVLTVVVTVLALTQAALLRRKEQS